MNPVFFIARRLLKQDKNSLSNPMIRIAVMTVALSVAVMILAIAIVTGFQRQIREKIIGFGGHIQVTRFDANSSFEGIPMNRNQAFLSKVDGIPGVRHIQVFATKPGIIRTNDDIQGVVLKGVDSGYDWSFFETKITQGTRPIVPDTGISNQVLISEKLAKLLRLQVGDDIRTYFIINQAVRARKFTISGFYSTGLEEFDKLFVFCDIRHIQRLSGWQPDEVAGFEILVDDFQHLDAAANAVYQTIDPEYNAQSIRELYPQLFDWLHLQDMNVIVILTLMTVVALVTMSSALLIIILERVKTIGVLKALGSNNHSLRKVFLAVAAIIILRGLFWGNLVGLSLALIQQKFGIIRLPEESYYVSFVPVGLVPGHILLLDLATLFVCTIVMIIPTVVVSSVSPVKTLRFS